MAKAKVYFDSNVFIQAGKPPGGPVMSRVRDLVKADLIEVLTTDLTISEVAKKHTENDLNAIKDVSKPHFRKLVKEHLETKLPEVSKEEIREAISKKYAESVGEMLSGLDAKVLAIDDIKPTAVFKAYSDGSGFFSGDGKKDQFPDSFIFECLKNEASANSPVTIVSQDGDFDTPVDSEANISLVKSIPELFKNLGLEVEAPEIEEFLDTYHAVLMSLVDGELNDWGLQVSDMEGGEIEETTVKSIEPTDLVSFGSSDEDGNILIIGTVEIVASVTYSHPNWAEAVYDSEDKRLYPFEDVSGVTEVTVSAAFSMSIIVGEDGKAAGIEEFRFTNDDFVFVELYPYDPNEFM